MNDSTNVFSMYIHCYVMWTNSVSWHNAYIRYWRYRIPYTVQFILSGNALPLCHNRFRKPTQSDLHTANALLITVKQKLTSEFKLSQYVYEMYSSNCAHTLFRISCFIQPNNLVDVWYSWMRHISFFFYLIYLLSMLFLSFCVYGAAVIEG